MISAQQTEAIRYLKGSDAKAPAKDISIIKYDGTLLGALRPVDEHLAKDKKVRALLTSWRRKFMRYFLTQFDASEERTAIWLEKTVLKDDTRVLFLIVDSNGNAVGNFSVCNIDEESAELDNLIRGEKGGDPRLIFFSELCLMKWVYQVLKVNNICLHVFDNNRRTIALHESVGFSRNGKYRLSKTENTGSIEYKVDKANKPGDGELGLVRMEMDKRFFLKKYMWLEE